MLSFIQILANDLDPADHAELDGVRAVAGIHGRDNEDVSGLCSQDDIRRCDAVRPRRGRDARLAASLEHGAPGRLLDLEVYFRAGNRTAGPFPPKQPRLNLSLDDHAARVGQGLAGQARLIVAGSDGLRRDSVCMARRA